MEMTTIEAIKFILELAEDNMLSYQEASENDLMDEREKQMLAIQMVRDSIK